MSEEKTLFEKLYEVGEENLARFTEEVLSDPVCSDTMDQTLRNAAKTKEKVDQNIAALLSLLNLPSKVDYDRLLAKVETLQGSLVNVSVKLDRLLAAQKKKPKQASRTSRPGPTSRTAQSRKKKPVSQKQ
jgi:hypothetical protein